MNYTLPHTIENCIGEKIIFKTIIKEQGEEKLLLENFVTPGNGPIMHTHFKQDETLIVKSGLLGYQLMGEEPKFASSGETITFLRGTPHRFWNAGDDILNCVGWVKPANSIVFYLTALYNAQNKSGSAQPEKYDAAYLFHRYKSEYDIPELPRFVKSVILPLTYAVGKLTGKYTHFKDAPPPLEN